MIAAPGFWWEPRPTLQALLLSPVSYIWAWRSSARMRREPVFRAPVPVICIGNFVVGGAGKTPTSLTIATIARRLGRKPGFLAPGYGGREQGPLLVDAAQHNARDVGDEPLLLAEAAPTAIGRDRAASAKLLLEQGVDLIIMDDGFQNPTLSKDLSVVCVDGAVGIGNGLVMPSGPLRAPLTTQMERAHAILIIGDGPQAKAVSDRASAAGKPIFSATLVPERSRDWRGERVLAFAGIGRPAKFFRSLESAGADVVVSRSFSDHHPFTEDDASALFAEAEAQDLRLVTTEKDRVRLAGEGGELGRLYERAAVFGVRLSFANEPDMETLIMQAIGENVSPGASTPH